MLDRDGVINEDSGDFIKSRGGVAADHAAVSRRSRRCIAAATAWSSSRISRASARGLYDEDDARADSSRTCATRVRAAGGALAGIYYCPHLPDAGCDCRKPRPGMFRALERELGVLAARRAVHRRSIQRRRSRRGGRRARRCWCGPAPAPRRKRVLGARRVRGVRRSSRPQRAHCSPRRDSCAVRQWIGSIAFTLFCSCPCRSTGSLVLADRAVCPDATRTRSVLALGATRCCCMLRVLLPARLHRRGPRAPAAHERRSYC